MAGGSDSVQYILLTDIGRSSYLWETFPEQYPAALEVHNHLTESCVEAAGGTIMKNMGDGYIALFPDAHTAVAGAVALQLSLSAAERPIPPFADGTELQLRVIVHCGELHQMGTGRGWFGTPLNRAARICGVCHPGQVLLSESVRDALGEALPDGTEIIDMGSCRLRDLGEPEQLFQLSHPGFVRTSFPPLLTLDNAPNNLVTQSNAFIGREAELKEIARMFAGDTRLVTLHSPGGYGKTRLANQVAAHLLGRFANGVYAVQLAPLKEAARLPEAIAAATGFLFTGSREPEQQILDYLRTKDMLLVFDNFEHVLGGAKFVSEVLKLAPKVRILATSREPLRLSGEQIYRLGPLPTGAGSDSVQLFADRATQVKPDFALDDETEVWVERICSRLEGVPLSIELTAAWSDSFTLPEMHAELGQQLDLTARMGDVPERQRSVRASCDWSWSLLKEEQRVALMQLAVFRGGFFPEAAGAVLKLAGMPLRAVLAGLLDKSWLYVRQVNEKTRYSIRDAAAWEYAFEHLRATKSGLAPGAEDDSTFEVTARAHAAFFAQFADQEGARLDGDGTPTGQLEALRVWKQELANISEAIDTALSRTKVEWLLPIARHLSRFLNMVGDSLGVRERYSVLLQAARQHGSEQLELSACLGLGRALSRLGRHGEAKEMNDAARELASRLGEQRAEGMALLNLGTMEYLQGRNSDARQHYQHALQIQREIADRYGEAASLQNLGIIEASQGDYAAARENYLQSLAIKRQIGDSYGEAFSLNSLGGLEGQQGNYAAGRDSVSQALGIFRELGDRSGEANALIGLGNVECREDMFENARGLFSKALIIKREIGDRNGESWVLSNLGIVEYCLRNYSVAGELFEEALLLQRELNNRFGQARVLSNLGNVAASLSDFEGARNLYCDALALEREIGDKAGMALTCGASTAAMMGLGLYQDAAVMLHAALRQAKALNYHFGPDDQRAIDAATAALKSAAAEGLINLAEMDSWQKEADGLELEALVEFSLLALRKAPATTRPASAPAGIDLRAVDNLPAGKPLTSN